MTATMPRGLLLLLTIAACEKAAPTRTDAISERVSLPAAAPIAADTTVAAELAPSADVAGASARSNSTEADATEPARSRPAPTIQAPSSPAATTQEVTPGSMLVRVGHASLQVDSLDTGIARVRDVARRTGAVVANTSMEGGREQTRSASLQLRVPSERFDEAVNALAPIGKLESVNVSVEDVGEEFVDVQARVANAKRLEQRLVDLLATRTGKLADVLRVERELARVREEIERYDGRLRYLRSRASVSTLTVAVHEPYPIVATRPGARPIRDAFVQAWRNLVGFTAGFIALLGILVPLGAVLLALVIIGRRVVPSVIVRLTPVKTTSGAGRV